MGFHTFDADRAPTLNDPARFERCSVEELFGALAVDERATVADLGSGTGLYTSRLAAGVGQVYAVDVQAVMHGHYREAGVPSNVELVAADIGNLPFADDALDGAVSTFTFHEFASADALAECRRVLAPGTRLALVDWSAAGTGEGGPPTDERYDATDATRLLTDAGFAVPTSTERRDTFAVTARVPDDDPSVRGK